MWNDIVDRWYPNNATSQQQAIRVAIKLNVSPQAQNLIQKLLDK
jgi:hypothetical protein